ncbi:MAG: hypothetical protein EXR75_12015 [Myxococcales bacterium]|nr:hypothetical protein [Myxococcales bacterium]
MMRVRTFIAVLLALVAAPLVVGSCSATGNSADASSGSAGTFASTGANGGSCGQCEIGSHYVPCNADGTPGAPINCPLACTPGLGCSDCTPGEKACAGSAVHQCTSDGKLGELVETCDVAGGMACSQGECKPGCAVANDQPSNVGCEFWAVDLDQQDGFNDPASAPWGVVLANAGDASATVKIEKNDAPVGMPPQLTVVATATLAPGKLEKIVLPTRELDCGIKPNDYASPGTCLSSNAYRITATAPIVVYQFNVFENAYSNDASLLLPTNALGYVYRVINWSAGHPVKIGGFNILDRSYVTIVGTEANTHVTVKPTWRVRGNGSIPATPAGGTLEADLGPFDVLNLETDDATLAEAGMPRMADFTGTVVQSNHPVAVFSGVESTSAPYHVDIPKYPGWTDDSTCCLDHLEEQMFPLESIGRNFVITRSPVRSTGSYKEPDVLRFLGAAATTTVTTTLPPPFDKFTLEPGEVRDTWADADIIVSATEPVLIGQLLVSQGYVDGPLKGDPSLTVFPPVEQYRSDYVFLTPGSWSENWVVISAETGSLVSIDGGVPASCIVAAAGMLEGKSYEARRCPLGEGAHTLTGDKPFGIIAYGYGNAGSYAFAGGADVKRIYEPPPIN